MCRISLIGLLAGLVMSLATETAADEKSSADVKTLARGNTAFAADLFGQVRTKSGNLFCSPLSISAALAMTSAGAKGETLTEITKVLHLPESQEATHAGFAALMEQLTPSAGQAKYELHIANALWAQQGFPFRPEFLGLTEKQYKAGLRNVDFRRAADAVKTINRWIEEQTKDKIKDLLSPSDVSSDTRLVLTNAIYFKGKWKKPFDKKATRDEEFYLSGGSTAKAPLMHQSGNYRHFSGDGLQAVALPYDGGNLEMLVLLPAEKDGLAKVEGGLTAEKLDGWVKAMRPRNGDVAVPRFKFTAKFELSDALQALGMKRAFTGDADFSGMSTADRLAIDKVIHQAFIDVNEEGSEAAAATAVTVKREAARPRPEERFTFRADHPFLFAIRDAKTESLLFLGRVTDPTKE